MSMYKNASWPWEGNSFWILAMWFPPRLPCLPSFDGDWIQHLILAGPALYHQTVVLSMSASPCHIRRSLGRTKSILWDHLNPGGQYKANVLPPTLWSTAGIAKQSHSTFKILLETDPGTTVSFRDGHHLFFVQVPVWLGFIFALTWLLVGFFLHESIFCFSLATMVAFLSVNMYTYGRELSIILPASAHLFKFTCSALTAPFSLLGLLLRKQSPAWGQPHRQKLACICFMAHTTWLRCLSNIPSTVSLGTLSRRFLGGSLH